MTPKAVLDVARLAGADDGDVYGGVRECPRDGQLTHRDVMVGREDLQCSHGREVAAVAAGADVLITMLIDGAAVEQVTAGPTGAISMLSPGAIWIQMSTVGRNMSTSDLELLSDATHPAIESHVSNVAGRLNWLRAAVVGANDGIVSTAGLVVGVAAATTTTSLVFTAGLAGLVAGAVSMALGEYVSVSTQRDTQRALLQKERQRLADMPEAELEELQ